MTMTDVVSVPESQAGAPDRPVRVCFLFNAQRHQLLHGISTAVQLARRPGFEVHVTSPSQGHVDYARTLVGRLGGAPIVYSVVRPPMLDAVHRVTGAATPPKALSLVLLAGRLNAFDAIAVPERTSILLKRLGVRAPKYIHLDHGAGDRAAGFDPRIREFDLALMAGEKHRDRMAREGLIHPGRHAVVGYPKFEAADAARDPEWRPFANGRPIVLYNPHFSDLGSWEAFGEAVLQAFAGQDRYNLIVAPHVRMLERPEARAEWRALEARYAGSSHIRIDLGSDRCIDMTYTALSDVYLGDVSSQVYEFLRTPKPCVFLDPRDVDWRGDENYSHWRFGPVVRSPDAVLEAIDQSITGHWRYLDAQIDAFDETFSSTEAPASARAADAIASYLAGLARPVAPARATWSGGWRRAAMVAAAVGAGLAGYVGIDPGQREASAGVAFVEEAVESHSEGQIQGALDTHVEVTRLDPATIRKATGVRLPPLPADWVLIDVRIESSTRGPIVQVAMVTDEGEPLSLVAMRIETPADQQPRLASHRGERVAFWDVDGQAFGVVGPVAGPRLLRIASDLAGSGD